MCARATRRPVGWVAHLYHLAPMGTQNGKPGRPRDPHADEAILAAARDLLAEGGLANLTVEGTAQRAGVAKTTVYRRYPTKLDLAVAAVADLVSGGGRNLTASRMAYGKGPTCSRRRSAPWFPGGLPRGGRSGRDESGHPRTIHP